MPVNLTKIRGRLNNVKKKIYYENPKPLKLLNIDDELAVLYSNWFMPTSITTNFAIGAEYWELYIADVVDDYDLEEIIPETTTVEIEGERYRVFRYTRPRGVTKHWYLRLEATGERAQ